MIFLFSEMSRQAVGPPILLFKGYGDSSLGVKWPGYGVDHSSPKLRLRMSGAVPLFPRYAFMAWTGQLSLIRDSTVEGCNKHIFVAMMQEWPKVSHSGVITGKERKSGLNLQ